MKIMIVGAGGIGGVLAGMLSRKYPDITVVARGAHGRAIRENGLHVKGKGGNFTVRPSLVTDDPKTAGVQDAILICTKGYGLDGALAQIAPCVGEDTLLIPLLNGINTHKRIAEKIGRGVICEGAIYMFGHIVEPGVVERASDMLQVCMGIPHRTPTEPLLRMRDMLVAAGVPCTIPEDILAESWQKWMFILANGQALAYFGVPAGEMREDPAMMQFTLSLLEEGVQVARAEGVAVSDTIVEDLLSHIFGLAHDSRSSLARDLMTPGRPTELDQFAGELCRLAARHGIAVPCNSKVLERFLDRV